jgi:probable addiction module antidote protein
MALKTTRVDTARYFTTPEDQAALLTDALETGDAGYIAHALGIVARARGMTEVARGAGVTREALYRTLSRDGDPRLTTLLGVVRTLGFTLAVRPATEAAATTGE